MPLFYNKREIELLEERYQELKALFEQQSLTFAETLREARDSERELWQGRVKELEERNSDLLDKVLQRYGSTARRLPQAETDEKPFALRPLIASALEDDEREEREQHLRLEEETRRRLAEVDPAVRDGMRAAAAAATTDNGHGVS